jgi:FkbH-like protein
MMPSFEAVRTHDGIELTLEDFEGGNQEVDLLVAVQDGTSGVCVEFRFDRGRLESTRVRELRNTFLRYVDELTKCPENPVPKNEDLSESSPYQIVVAATFSAESLADSLRFWGRQFDTEFAISFAPVGQLVQELVRVGSGMRNVAGAAAILVRLSDWDSGNEPLGRKVDELIEALRTSAQVSGAPHLLCFVPSKPLRLVCDSAPSLEDGVADALADIPGVRVLTSDGILSQYPVENYRDAEADDLALIPFTPTFFAALGSAIVRALHAIDTLRPKVIAVDCDNTLWSGVCGEDGPDGIGLEPHRLWLQHFLVKQHDEGVLLVLCSKNNEKDVEGVFKLRSAEMPLRRSHVAREALNWRPKSENLFDLAQSLDLGIDSFVLIDDNPVECAEVRARCPGLLVLELPVDPVQIPSFLSHVWAFDCRPVSREDRRRTEYYRNEEVRSQSLAKAPTMLEFLRGLDLQLSVSELAGRDVPRASQLTFRTNQFTTSGVRWSVTEVEAWRSMPGQGALAVHASDRFGDYGLVSLILYRICHSEMLMVESWSLSCRALGRAIEHRIVAHLGSLAINRGLPKLSFRFRGTGANLPALEFLRSISSEEVATSTEILFNGPAPSAAGCFTAIEEQWGNQAPISRSKSLRRVGPLTRPSKFRGDLARIACEFTGAAQVLSAIRASYSAHVSQGDPPQTPTEEALAVVWSELLAVDSPSRTDDFFELGGDSVGSMRMLAEIRRRFSVELTIESFFTREPTIAEIADAIDRARSGLSVGSESITSIAGQRALGS